MMKKHIIFLLSLLCISLSLPLAVFGGPTGYWSDASGNNYYGDPPSASSSQSSSSTYYNNTTSNTNWAYQQQQQVRQQQILMQQQIERENAARMRREKEMERRKILKQKIQQNEADLLRQKEVEIAQREEESLRNKEKWKKGKTEIISALKGSNSDSKLKLKGLRQKRQEDYYKTLDIQDVPLPAESSVKENIDQDRNLAQKSGEKKDSGKTIWKKIGDKKKQFIDWLHLKTFDETFNQTPIVRGFRSLQKKTKAWYGSMKELVVGVYDHGMTKFERGVNELGRDNPYRGSVDEGEDKIGQKTKERAGKMASSEVEGKAGF